MDHVDHGLAEDVLKVLCNTIKRNSRHDLNQIYHSQQSQIMHMNDCFYFSKVTRGALLLNDVEINWKDELFTCLLFKIHMQEIQDELQMMRERAYAQKNE